MNARSGERWLQQVLDAMTEQIAVLDRGGHLLKTTSGPHGEADSIFEISP